MRRRSAILFICAGGLIAVLLGTIYLRYILAAESALGSAGLNALWISHKWVGDPQTDKQYSRLARLLLEHEITDAFFHVGPLNNRGEVEEEKFSHARPMLQSLKAEYPGIRAQAWLGQVEAGGGGPLDLSDPTTRRRIVRTSESFLALGFDGIHYDIEPIYPGDKDFLALLRETHQATERSDAVLSVASEDLDLFGKMAPAVRSVFDRYHQWTPAYYREVSRVVDQIAVMSYDTAMPFEWLYGSFVKWETERILNSVDQDAVVFMGVPTYDEPNVGHLPGAENMGSGIRAVRKGLQGLPTGKREVGLAIYAEWTTSDEEWNVYSSHWLGAGGHKRLKEPS